MLEHVITLYSGILIYITPYTDCNLSSSVSLLRVSHSSTQIFCSQPCVLLALLWSFESVLIRALEACGGLAAIIKLCVVIMYLCFGL